MADSPTLLLLARNAECAARLATLARQVGFRVVPGRHHELGAEALERVQPHVVLVERGHEAALSRAFRERARQRRLRCVLLETDAPHGYSARRAARTDPGWDYVAPASADELRVQLTKVLRGYAV